MLNTIYNCYNQNIPQKHCTLSGISSDRVAVCETCKERTEAVTEEEVEYSYDYVTTTKLVSDSLRLARYVPSDCIGIVGVARSGLIPASILATHLHLPLYELSLSDFKTSPKVNLIKGGCRITEVYDNDISGRMFIVDDTVYNANTMDFLRSIMPKNDLLSAVYVRPGKENSVDHYAKLLPAPHFLEWNLFNSDFVRGIPNTPFAGGIAFDFDGILCEDPISGQDRVHPLDWLADLKPTGYCPRKSNIPLIITMRLEKWREKSDKWLKKYNIGYDNMKMVNCDNAELRDANFMSYLEHHKAKCFKESDCFMMIESDPMQAQFISEYSGKPVLCPIEGKIYRTE